MRNRLLAFGWCWLLANVVLGQYANDWINYSQTYYKLKIAETGLYRVTAAELEQAGVPVSTIPDNRYQLFRRGQEVSMLVTRKGDNTLDYLEFYAERNDGRSDTPLYEQASDQPHTFYSLFSDTASYFLTWKLVNESGRRMEASNNNNTAGINAEPYHLMEDRRVLTNQYATGPRFGSNNDLLSAKYLAGEGWTGSNIGKNASQTFTFTLTQPVKNAGANPELDLLLMGLNNLDHVVEIYAGPSAENLRSLGQALFTRQETYRFTRELAWSDVSATDQLVVRVTALGVANQAELVSVAYVQCQYPQQVQFAAANAQQTYLFGPSALDRKYVQVTTTVPGSLRVFDVTSPLAPRRLAQSVLSGRLDFVFENPTTNRRMLVVQTPLTVPSIQRAPMTQINATGANYLIIHHPTLNTGTQPVTAYANYRGSAAGGGYAVRTFAIGDVFDQYGYGDPSPLAIRNLIQRWVATGSLEYVLLLGKGLTPEQNFYRQNPAITNLVNFIPSFGHPGSDILYGVLPGSEEPQVAIGRVNAYTSAEVQAYLDKVREQEALPFDALWRKNILQLSGGQTATERRAFSSYINNFRQTAEGHFLGARVSNISKSSNDATEVIPVTAQVNNGLSLITFFGHSSSVVTDIEIGRVGPASEFGYANQGKYPFLLVNGCNAGGIFGGGVTFGENWMYTANAGAVGFLANSDFATSFNLYRYSLLFHDVAFGDTNTFGETMGKMTLEIARRYFLRYGTSRPEQAQIHQTVYQGDPALRIFGVTQPDYALDQEEVFAQSPEGGLVTASLDSFNLHLIVRNFAKAPTDSLTVQVSHTFPDGSAQVYQRAFAPVKRLDTLLFPIKNDLSRRIDGENMFVIRLDPANAQAELNEANNQGNFSLFIPRGSTVHLLPTDFGVVSGPEAELIWQSVNAADRNRTYALEVDTLPQFTSAFAQRRTISGDVLVRATVSLAGLPDSATVYWRTRYASPAATEDTTWVQTSFTKVTPQVKGWLQADTWQQATNEFTGVTYDPLSGKSTFEPTSTPIRVVTHGPASTSTYADYQVLIDGVNFLLTDNLQDPECKKKDAINAVVFSKETAQPYRPIEIFGSEVLNSESANLVCGALPQRVYNFNQTDVLGSRRYLDSLVTMMKSGDMVVLFSMGTVNYALWDTRLLQSLASLGISASTIASLTNGQPVIMLGRKGAEEGTAVVMVNDGSATPIASQTIELIDAALGRRSSGSVTTRRIGPATRWQSFSYEVQAELDDFFGFNVIGITSDGTEQQVASSGRMAEVALSDVDAAQYPFIRLNYSFSDPESQTPAQLQSWGVVYEQPAEGVLLAQNVDTDQLQEGEPYQRSYWFTNVSEVDFQDSLTVNYATTNVETGNREERTLRIGPPAAGDTTRFEAPITTRGKVGVNQLTISVLGPEPELYTTNNAINSASAFQVSRDQTNPVLDVTFDGVYLLDGDIISPNPQIVIRFQDDNPYLYKQDTTGMVVELRQPCETCLYQRVFFSDPKISYTPAAEDQPFEVNYQPGPLEDGTYALRVQGTDESGNASGMSPYEISFQVINASTITHFYPYPNPFSTSTRFVFTLTGSVVPDQLKIQIMTVSGRVVREITQDEIGPIRIGNNMTQYAWDGRDEYGDLLANGVYFYRVFIRQNGETIQHRLTNADRAFKNGFGKLYILR